MTTAFSQFETYPPLFTAWGYDGLNQDPHCLSQPLPSKYDLRIDARESNGSVPCTWVDQDNSGDFDPNNKSDTPLLPTKRKRDRPVRNDHGLFGQLPKKPKTNTWQSGRYTGQNGLVTFRIGSEHARAVLQAIGTSSTNWPHERHEHQETDSGDSHPPFPASSDPSHTSLTSAQYLLRKRQGDRLHDTTTLLNFEQVTLGHPAARGCKACLDLCLPCPLLQEGSIYPCLDCRQDDIECELILPPTRKAACESCKRRRVVCSYRGSDGSDHSLPCPQCVDVGLRCVAGPATGRTRMGPSLDQGLGGRGKMVVRPPKAIASCVQCRQVKKWCSSRGRKDRDPPCKGCRESGSVCTKESLPADDGGTPQNNTKLNVNPSTIAVNNLTPNLSTTTINLAMETKTITTRLAHPIIFNYLPRIPTFADTPTTSPEPDCHFHPSLVHALLGLPSLRTTVFDPQDGTGYIELPGQGHTSQGHLPTRVCEECTTERLRIVACEGHAMRAIAGIGDMEGEWWMEQLLEGNEGEGREWCAVCITPAAYGCCTRNPELQDPCGTQEQEDADEGCGLRLCSNCAARLGGECGGSLDRLVRRVVAEDEDEGEGEGEGGLGVRADVGFLLPEGEMLRRVWVE